MLRQLGHGLLISSLLLSVSAADNGFSHCSCDDDSLWAIENILKCQKVSDLLIALAYFSIPIELGYFVSCSNLPFKWVLGQFIAFIVLCGLTHLFTAWIYEPHSFQLMLALTIFKFLTALVSCATSITLVTMIPLLLRVKVRELFLKRKTRELDREVGMMKKQEEASWHVRMLTQEIRKTLDRHTILYTTLVELSKTLELQNCAVWMPNEDRTEMILTHELKQRKSLDTFNTTLPYSDRDVQEIKGSKGVKLLRPDSVLSLASSGDAEPGAVAGIRMPMLRVSNFKGGTPELVQACYAVLVLVLPNADSRFWSIQELEIVEVVADQVAVALSHAAVLEESQLMREKLAEQNQALQQARRNAMMASQARNSFQRVMAQGMRRPMHSISGLLSMIQQENLGPEQRIIVDTMVKTGSVISTLINDVMEISTMDDGRLGLEMRPLRLHAMIKEVASLAKCLCVSRGFDFEIQIENAIPDYAISDEKRIFQVILHMIGNLLNGSYGGLVTCRFLTENGNDSGKDHKYVPWRPSCSTECFYVRIDIGTNGFQSKESISSAQLARRPTSNRIEEDLSFSVCRKLVQMMQGNIWVVPNSQGLAESMTLLLRFQTPIGIHEPGGSSDQFPSNSLFRGLKVLVADDDDVNRAVTRKLLEKLGCQVSAVSSGFECLRALGMAENSFQVVLLDLHMPEMDGFEVAVRIRKYRSGSWPSIVALTASANEDVCERCLQAGMNGVIQKPVLLQGMGDELRRVLQHMS